MSWHCSGERRWIYPHILVLTITFALLGLVQLVHFGGKHIMMYIVGTNFIWIVENGGTSKTFALKNFL
jgi:hypothetical protein